MKTRINHKNSSECKEPRPLSVSFNNSYKMKRFTLAQIHMAIINKGRKELGISRQSLVKYIFLSPYTFNNRPITYELLKKTITIQAAQDHFKDLYHKPFQIVYRPELSLETVLTIIIEKTLRKTAELLGIKINRLIDYISYFQDIKNDLSPKIRDLINQLPNEFKKSSERKMEDDINDEINSDINSTHNSNEAKIDESSSQINSELTKMNILSSENNGNEPQTFQVQSDFLNQEELEAFLKLPVPSLEFYNTQNQNLLFPSAQAGSEQAPVQKLVELDNNHTQYREPEPLTVLCINNYKINEFTLAQVHEFIINNEEAKLGISKILLKKYLVYSSYTLNNSPLSYELLKYHLSISAAQEYFKNLYNQRFQLGDKIHISLEKALTIIIEEKNFSKASKLLGVDIYKLRNYISYYKGIKNYLSQKIQALINQLPNEFEKSKKRKRNDDTNDKTTSDTHSTHHSKEAKIDESSSQINSEQTEMNILISDNNVSEPLTLQEHSDVWETEILSSLPVSSFEFYNTDDQNLLFTAKQNNQEQDLQRFEEIERFILEQNIP